MRPVWNLPLDASGVLVELDNGTTVRIRPVRKSDREGLLSAFEHFSAESRYMRFFSPRPRLTEKMIETFTDVDDVSQLAWGVFDPNEPSEVGDESGLAIASARLFFDDDPRSAEATLAVVDGYQRRGLGGFVGAAAVRLGVAGEVMAVGEALDVEEQDQNHPGAGGDRVCHQG